MNRRNKAAGINPEKGVKAADLVSEHEALLYENAKLKKINQVLMQRVEMGWGNHSDAYRSFESAVLLADKVKERTYRLQQTLNRLEETNDRLTLAQRESEQARQRLVDAIESFSDAFVLFDDQRRMILANSRFFEFWESEQINFEAGVSTLRDITDRAKECGLFDPKSSQHEKITRRDGNFGEGVFCLTNGRWIQMSERRTTDGGLVVIYTDITAIKESETLRREQALAEQARLLQSTLENMSQGVALINAEQCLEAWNSRFIALVGVDKDKVRRGANFKDLLLGCELTGAEQREPVSTFQGGSEIVYEFEKLLSNGRVLLVRSHLIPGGGFVNTYSDITERSRNEEALRESERRIRLVTDAMPALIFYVNKERRYDFVNRSFEDWFDRPRSEIIGKNIWEVMGEKEYENHRKYIDKAMAGQPVSFEVEQTLGRHKGRISYTTYVPHYGADNRVIGFFALEQDITEQRRTAKALKHAYQHMEQRVYERTKEISEVNQQLRMEIEERQQAEAHLLEAKGEAEKANISKTKFMAAASHDLLQPLNAARLFAAALLENELADKAHKLAKSLSYSLENVESLISSLVDISKLDAGVMEAVPGVFRINELLNNIANEFKQQAGSAGLELRYRESDVAVYSDSQLLARILRNLLTNAIRYTEEGGILLCCRRRKEGLEIQVWDTGIGIPEGQLQEIFGEFKRVNAKKNRDDRGLGLGLAIVDKISSVLKHKINVRSKLGKGSRFSVTVPYGEISTEKTTNIHYDLDKLSGQMRDRRILVIDDDASICEGMESLLTGWGCQVVTVLGLEEISSRPEILAPPPDLIIADYHLDEGATGVQAIELIHQKLVKNVPVIMITANYTNELRQQVREWGYVLLRKPILPLKLKSAMAHIFKAS